MSEIYYSDHFKQMAYYYMSLLEGDTHLVDDAMLLMQESGFINDANEWIDDDDDEEDI